ncbi:hypothetical protein CSKR_100908 [Clonorchis sinensis]|uniref:NAD dependent epimerase/dehydratase n=2 Tax=Clonorchis sinensis TaxID=79923 RepID=G7YAB3_CLOSI|nr:hypothetical protein CSKR_100908 [Clonorchis sinensis]GAA49897.1 NAD dependent epimerase/dehydratase [Clonorchis sinensis]
MSPSNSDMQYRKNSETGKVFVVGVDKTGTSFVKTLLQTLCLQPCLHSSDLSASRTGILSEWVALADESDKLARQKKLGKLLENYRFAAGFPVVAYLDDLLEMYPSAKFILTVREAEPWLATIRSTSLPRAYKNSDRRLVDSTLYVVGFKRLEQLNRRMFKRLFGPNVDLQDDNQVIQAYIRWNDYVRSVVPENQLLVYRVKDRWEPLCQFLGVPVPDKPFPNTQGSLTLTRIPKSHIDRLQHFIICLAVYILIGFLAIRLLS